MRASRAPPRNRRPPLSGKQPTPTTTRKERRAAERRDRFEAARDERKTRSGSGGGGGSFINTKTMTIVGVAVGVLIVAVVGIGQLGNRVTGRLADPQINYPATVLDGTALGKADAPLVMEVYSDFQCPVCARHSLDIEPLLIEYVNDGSLRIVHHDIDLLGRGTDESRIPALGAVCANDQGKYATYSHWIYNNQQGENAGGFRKERVIQIAAAAGLDEVAFRTCLDTPAPAAEVAAITAKATGELGINSTPTMYLAGTKYVGLKSASDWAALIDAELAKLNPSAAPSVAPSVAPSAAPSASTTP
jgi:protein-disulfide isomerase